MSNYTTEDITRFLSPKFEGEHDWDDFVARLDKAGDDGVWLPQIGQAYLVEQHSEWDGDAFFVFRIHEWGGDRFFRVTSDSSYSFGGVGYSDLEEVREVPVQRTSWETI